MELSKSVQREIVSAVRQGLAGDRAAQMAGVSSREWADWVARGADGEQPYAKFMLEVEKARAKFQAMLLDKLQQHGSDPKSWTALAWILERTDPEHYAQRQVVKVQVERELVRALDVLSKVLPHDHYARAVEALAGEFGVDIGPREGSSTPAPTTH